MGKKTKSGERNDSSQTDFDPSQIEEAEKNGTGKLLREGKERKNH